MIMNLGAGGGSAENTTYDNTESGLQATNVQDAIDGITSNLANLLKWKIVDSATADNVITLPSEFNEILISVAVQPQYADGTHYNYIISQNELSETARVYRIGYGYSNKDNSVAISVSLDSAKTYSVKADSVNALSGSITTIYYR